MFCLKMHKEMAFNLKSILEQWKMKLSSGSHIVLRKYFNFYLDRTDSRDRFFIYISHLQMAHDF